MTLKIGYKASAEQFAPRDLVEFAVLADDLGLDSVMVSDHYQPWRHEGGHAPFSLAWLAAVGERTSNVVLGTSVLTATFRYNPAVLAQAFGTLGCLYPGRVVLGVGSGEALNEVAVARIEWPAFKERFARLREAVDLMRTLWREERVSFEGEYFQTTDATVYDRPDGGVPIYIAAGGPVMAKYVGRQGDGFSCTSGKGMDLYTEKLLPALGEGAALARPSPRSSPTSTRVSTTLSSMAPAMTRNGFSAASRSRCCPACGHWMPDGSGLMAEWAVVIPVKRWAMAKSRVGGLRSADRRDLAAALAHDVIRTVCATPAVARCVVVGPDEVVRELRRCSGALLGVEEVQERSADPLNTALRQGRDAALAAGHRQIAMIMADMPALTVSGLTAFLQLMPTTGVGVVRDRSRTGTTILAGRAGHTVCPAFGPDSATRHIAGGAIDLTSSCDPGLRIDVDTWADLVAVRRFAGPALRRWFDECAAPRRACPPVTPAALSRNQV